MEFNPACLINIIMAFLALFFYILGSYSFYIKRKGFIVFLGLGLAIDVLTATLASLKITPTMPLPGAEAVPWYSLLFNVHVTLSMIGITGFFALFVYLLASRPDRYRQWVRRWQFRALLPVWIIGEGIALCNSLLKICCGIRLFDLV